MAIKKIVHRRENGFCFWCDDPVTRKDGTFDHIILHRDGGKYEPDNGVLSCWKCNNRRGDLDADTFARYMWGDPAQI